MDTALQEQIKNASLGKSGQLRIKCPNCSEQRKKKTEKTMSLSIEGEAVLYNCWHCEISGKIYKNNWSKKMTTVKIKDIKPTNKINIDDYRSEDFTVDHIKLLEDRKLCHKTLSKQLGLVSGLKYFSGNNFNSTQPSLGFPYKLDGEVNAIKWRSLDGKNFTQDGSAQTFWNIENAVEGKPLIIVEGEFDVCAMITCELDEHYNIVSVPNGACLTVADKVNVEDDKKFKYLLHAQDLIEKTDKIILAVDSDQAGQNLQTELSRRIGMSKIWTVDWKEHKDANECLVNVSAEEVRKIISNAKPIPMAGLFEAINYEEEFDDLYENGYMTSYDVGLDLPFKLAKGLLVLSTGLPSEGKSSLVDQMCINMAIKYGFKTNYMSFEKPPALHMAQLSQLYIQKPYFKSESKRKRMTKEEAFQSKEFIQEHFTFQDYMSGSPATIEGILERGQKAVASYSSDILVVDPFNFIQLESSKLLYTDTISRCLSSLQQFAKRTNTIVILVAHPSKPADRSSNYQISGLDVAGSMSFYAKSDIGFTVTRNREEECVDVYCWKCRWNFLGDQGTSKLHFDIPTGTYTDHTNGFSWGSKNGGLDFLDDANIEF